MSKRNGFSLIELIIVLSICGILAATIVQNVVNYRKHGKFLPLSPERCVSGYKFLYNVANGNMTQVLNGQGHGIPCE